MKQRYILPALLLLCSACQQEEWAQPEADSPDAIHFAAPVITVEKLTRSTFHDAFPTGGTFGVLGYCVPYQRGSNTEKDWASGSANWGNKSGNAFPDVFFNQAVTYNGSACTYDYIITVAARENGTTRRKIGDLPRQLSVHLFRLLPEGRFYSGKSRQRHHTGRAETDVHHAVRRDGRCSDYHVERHADTRRDGFRRL